MRGVTFLLAALLVGLACSSARATPLPHVDECNFCMSCLTKDEEAEAAASSSTSSRLRTLQQDPGQQQLQQQQLQEIPPGLEAYSGIFPTLAMIQAKSKLPNCTRCRGCEATLKPLTAVVAFGQDFSVERGASPEWIFTTVLPKSKGGGKAVVKVWCMPIDKVHGTFGWKCDKSENAMHSNQLLIAQDRVAEECGLLDVTIKVWTAPVNAIEPSTGLHIWWDGLWMERAEGISLNQLSYITRKSFVRETIIDLLQTKFNRTRVIRAAMLDLLTSQCDRHGQNVFINENGQIKLIDNLQALQFNWINCGADSIFLPGTQKNELVRFGGNLVMKTKRGKAKKTTNPMVLLDYRCYVPGGRIGTEFPPDIKKCLTKFSGMTAQQIMDEYKFPFLRNAEALQTRASDMLSKGFEWTAQQGKPHNMPGKRYRWHAPCCNMTVDDKNIVACGHAWDPKPEFPFGSPITGQAWGKAYPDPGVFEGGTVFEGPYLHP